MYWQYYLVIVIKLKTYDVYRLQKRLCPFMRCNLEENEYSKEDQVPKFAKINRNLFIGKRDNTFCDFNCSSSIQIPKVPKEPLTLY